MDEKELREEVIRKYENGKSSKKIYQKLGRSESWFFKWLKRYRNEGKDWARSRSRRPHRIPHKIDKALEQAVIETRKYLESQRYAQIGALNISWHMREKGITPPSISTINRILKRNNLVRKKTPYEPKGVDYPSIPVTHSNYLHQLDIVGPRYLKTDGRFYSANIIDAYDRQCNINPSRGKTRKDITHALIRCWQMLGTPLLIQVA